MKQNQAHAKTTSILKKGFGLLDRGLLPKHVVNNITTEHLPVVKLYKALVNLIPESKPIFFKARKQPLRPSREGHKDAGQRGQPWTGTARRSHWCISTSPVVWQRMKRGEMRLCVDLKVYIKIKVMDEWGLRYARHRNDLPQSTLNSQGPFRAPFFIFFAKLDICS